MLFKSFFTAGCVALMLGMGGAQAAPLEAYGALPSLSDVEISPDGSTIAYERSRNGKRMVLVQVLASGEIVGGVDVGQEKLRDITWAGNRHVIVTTSQTTSGRGLTYRESEWFLAVSFSLDRKKATPLMEYFPDDMRAMNTVADIPLARTVDGSPVVFVEGIYFKSSQYGRLGLFQVDLSNGRVKLIEEGTSETGGFLVNSQNVVVAKSEYDRNNRMWRLKQRVGGAWTVTYEANASIDLPYIAGLSFDGNAVVVGELQNGRWRYKQFALSNGSPMGELWSNLQVSGVLVEPSNSQIVGVQLMNDTQDYVFVHPRAKVVAASAEAAYPGALGFSVESWTPDWNKIVVKVSGKSRGEVFDIVDMNTKRADRIGQTYDGIGAEDFADVKWIRYAAADGMTIPAYVTLPNNKPAQNLPLIVLPHGGPASRDDGGFDWLPQALASRGYAVLQPQFRGSEGFGWDFMAAGFGQWGKKMQTDLSDGVRHLATQGMIDPKRVCIVGASYGGYAALAGVSMDPGVYRCAVSVAGLSDLEDFLLWRRKRTGGDSPAMRYWDRFMGSKGASDPALQAISPITHVARINVPVLLVHGDDDTVVPIDQSEDMESAMRRAGKQVSFVRLDSEDHWLSRSETRQKLLVSAVNFLEQHNPPH